jgi:hypothetical protein
MSNKTDHDAFLEAIDALRGVTAERDAARKEATDLRKELFEARNAILREGMERDRALAERDEWQHRYNSDIERRNDAITDLRAKLAEAGRRLNATEALLRVERDLADDEHPEPARCSGVLTGPVAAQVFAAIDSKAPKLVRIPLEQQVTQLRFELEEIRRGLARGGSS